MDRYPNASTQEKTIFTTLAKLITPTGFKVDHRRLEGSLTRPKIMFYLKKNNPAISHIEFITDVEGTPLRMRVIVAKFAKASEFYTHITGTLKGDKRYGGVVINWEAEDHTFPELLIQIGEMATVSEKILEPTKEPEKKEEK